MQNLDQIFRSRVFLTYFRVKNGGGGKKNGELKMVLTVKKEAKNCVKI